ncbi:MAG TPA: hypothetical protein VLM79_19515 [Kofleriaceae bacterium]|nr:hypothetical protein [Kofleriaceae bacterium]
MATSSRIAATTCLTLCVAAGTGCGGSAGDGFPDAGALSCFAGDRDKAPEISVVYRAADASLHPVEPAGSVPLIQPPQGGKVFFIGVRAHNLDGCPLDIRTALVDPATDQVISLEQRPVLLEDDGALGLAPKVSGGLSNFSNLPGCPRAGLARSINDELYRLSVSVVDQMGRTAEASVMIMPVCGEPAREAQCRCECAATYKLGDPCT